MPEPLPLEEVDRIAALAHLALTGDERVLFAHQLAEILAYAEQVREVDVSGVPPTSYALTPHAVFREDEPRASLTNDEALRNAPDAARDAGLFRVPRVIGA